LHITLKNIFILSIGEFKSNQEMIIDYFVQTIPSELFREFSEYLKDYGLFCLLNTTKKFQMIKYESRKIVLQNYRDVTIFLGSSEFRRTIYQKIQDPLLQLKIIYSSHDLTNILQIPSCELSLEIAESLDEVPDWIECLKNRGAIELFQNDKITHFDGLSSSMMKLSLVSFSALKNLSGLQNLLELSICRSLVLEDVSCLSKLKKLKLDACPNIKDVSCLGNIYDLSIIFCNGIKDINGLNNNFRLTIKSCPQLNDTSIKFQAVHLTTDLVITSPESFNLTKLRHFYLVDQFYQKCPLFWFEHLHTLSISKADYLTDVRGLYQVHTVIISQCKALEYLFGLGNNKHVKISHCNLVKNFQPLKTVFRVIIESCSGFTESSHLSNVFHLSVIHCWNLRNVLGFAVIHHLELKLCPQLEILKPIGKVPVVEIFSCLRMKINWEEVENEKLVFWKTELSAMDRKIASNCYLLIDDQKLETITLLRKT
jgi:hypothetical protein